MPELNLKTMKVESEWHRRLREGLEEAKAKARDAGRWVMDHPKETLEIVSGAAVIMGGAAKLGRGVLKNAALRKEKYNKERYIYDHSLNAYLKTRRPLKADDVKRINAIRRRTGEKLSEVLDRLNLLE